MDAILPSIGFFMATTPLPVDVCFLPSALRPDHLASRAVVVFDVLRATTSMIAALDAGVSGIDIYASTADVVEAGKASPGSLRCGEERCLPPPGFDLGNSPGAFQEGLHKHRTLLMSTTNGTRAILAARGASKLFVGALVNARAVAAVLNAQGMPVTLLCAGTDRDIAMEDILGAGAVMAELAALTPLQVISDPARIAQELFASGRDELPGLLRNASGGRNLMKVGREEDIDFAAQLNIFDVVGGVSSGATPRVTAYTA
jgi:2-phosphosulfolactate phosphatase